VVARRYRPTRFEEVVGQDHVVQALRNAIRLGKVTHAYLFSGTRGVGKTSVARIFAKCLNCQRGPTEEPCQVCDICQAIAVGQDVDVIEIDGASNNGVEAVRELRQNASLRPSRARYKIYYIDEVHMLSTGAFNALLKTLEEPPPHVKFFFATTEPQKIPITVLSRCQRYDFAAISPERLVESLAAICAREQVECEREALQMVARRAGGSLRDAQSLLEQLLAAGDRKLTADLVHQQLGIASDDRVLELIEALAAHDAAAALTVLDRAASSGVQPADMLSSLLEFFRDLVVVAAGANVDLLAAPPSLRPRLSELVAHWQLDRVLAAQQILAECRLRLRGSPHARILVELALVRVARLENFSTLEDLVAQLRSLERSGPMPPPRERTPTRNETRPRSESQAPAGARMPTAPPPNRGVHTPERGGESSPEPPKEASDELSLDRAVALWPNVIKEAGLRYGSRLSLVHPGAVESPDLLVIPLAPDYNYIAEECGTPEACAKIEAALQAVFGRPAKFRFQKGQAPQQSAARQSGNAGAANSDELGADPLVQKVVELFEARRVLVDAEDDVRD
jgi:DNA polymerase-3 subunit gamma/tau